MYTWEGGHRRGSVLATPRPLMPYTGPSDIQDITKTIIFTRHDVGFYPKTIGLQLNYVWIKFWFFQAGRSQVQVRNFFVWVKILRWRKMQLLSITLWRERKKSFPIIRNSSLGLWNMNKVVSLTDFWFCFIGVEGVVAFGMIHAKVAFPQASTEAVLLSDPLWPKELKCIWRAQFPEVFARVTW